MIIPSPTKKRNRQHLLCHSQSNHISHTTAVTVILTQNFRRWGLYVRWVEFVCVEGWRIILFTATELCSIIFTFKNPQILVFIIHRYLICRHYRISEPIILKNKKTLMLLLKSSHGTFIVCFGKIAENN